MTPSITHVTGWRQHASRQPLMHTAAPGAPPRVFRRLTLCILHVPAPWIQEKKRKCSATARDAEESASNFKQTPWQRTISERHGRSGPVGVCDSMRLQLRARFTSRWERTQRTQHLSVHRGTNLSFTNLVVSAPAVQKGAELPAEGKDFWRFKAYSGVVQVQMLLSCVRGVN